MTVHAGSESADRSEVAAGPPPIAEIVAAALRAHGPYAVSRALGLGRLACFAVALGLDVHAGTLFTVRARIDRLRALDEATRP
jgi:hypothetical protein